MYVCAVGSAACHRVRCAQAVSSPLFRQWAVGCWRNLGDGAQGMFWVIGFSYMSVRRDLWWDSECVSRIFGSHVEIRTVAVTLVRFASLQLRVAVILMIVALAYLAPHILLPSPS